MTTISTPVWDLPTRLFHWLLAASVIVAYLTGEDEGTIFAVHVVAGHLVLLLLLVRIVWGFIGSPRSRFTDFTYSWHSIREYATQLLRFSPPRHTGHNPLGGLMVFAMVVLLAAVTWTGLASAAAKGYQAGSSLIAMMGAGSRAAGELHETLGSLIMVLAGIHVLAVFLHWLLTGDNIIRAMITGRKHLPAAEAAKERPLAGPARGIALAVFTAVAAIGVMRGFDWQALVTRPAGEAGEVDTGDGENDAD
ncbi:MAG: cytochrome b/b6 domain-containing protein [Pseudomonadota bacterium]